MKARLYEFEDFSKLIGSISGGKIGIVNENGEWFYVTDNIDNPEKIVFSLLGKELNATILDIVVDITKWKVAALYQ